MYPRSVSTMRWLAALAAVVVVVMRAGVAEAGAAPREVVRLEYQAPEACPGRGALEAAIRERTTAAQLTSTGAGRGFAVDITERDGRYVGALAVDSDGDGVRDGDARELAAPRCDDLVTALGLVIALAIDPPGAVEEPPPPPPAPPAMAVVGEGGGVGGMSPGVAMTSAIEGRLGWRRLRMGAAALLGADRQEMSAGDASFLWIAGRASGCWQWLDRQVAGDVCAHLEVGGLRVRATDVARAQESMRLWLAPGAHIAVRWPAKSRVFAELQLGASVPLVRDRFHFARGIEIHQTWVVTPWAGLGLGMRFGRSR